VRVSSLGGIFGGITGREASVENGCLRLVLVRPPALVSLPVWFVCGWLGLDGVNPLVRILKVTEFRCSPSGGLATHVEADGEWLGRLPMRVSSVPAALRILQPEGRDTTKGRRGNA